VKRFRELDLCTGILWLVPAASAGLLPKTGRRFCPAFRGVSYARILASGNFVTAMLYELGLPGLPARWQLSNHERQGHGKRLMEPIGPIGLDFNLMPSVV